MTLNHYFNSNIQKSRNDRLTKKLAKYAFLDQRGVTKGIRLSEVNGVVEMGNTNYAVQEIYDKLKSYYRVARKRMVDNVCMQASNHFLFSSQDSPLRVFSAPMVSRLSADQLEEIAGEEAFCKGQRKELRAKIAKLEQDKKVLRS